MRSSTSAVIACVLTAALAGARPSPNVAPDTVHHYDYDITLYSDTEYYGDLQMWSGSVVTSSDSRKCDKCITVESDVKGSLKSLQFDPDASWIPHRWPSITANLTKSTHPQPSATPLPSMYATTQWSRPKIVDFASSQGSISPIARGGWKWASPHELD
ncbi:hypothetical protein BV22DRAFT_1116273 [Leucogyrophana mollusca]|uniref:Uncharacterized protein n=1 Tax=Leucogyrophana mollusca TaxID=85980 RepID=A0ACB8C020_9AGAM|nr:hypothetical protein BV22DRAFT_1116273 [Leucogyrophana mollusca]